VQLGTAAVQSLLNFWYQQTYGEWRKSKIHKLWALPLIIMSGCLVPKVCKMIGLCLGLFGCFIGLYSKLNGWVMEGNKYVAVGGDQAFLVVVLR